MDELKKFCARVYKETYDSEWSRLIREAQRGHANRQVSQQKMTSIENAAQKEAIKQATVQGGRQFPDVELAEVWMAVYSTHVYRKSGVDDTDTIAKVVSAEQSWRKSSGHAFEEMVKLLGTAALQEHGIEIILQKDLTILLKDGALGNMQPDIDWLKKQTGTDAFDLYAVVYQNEVPYCFGVVQAKTSVRDRVTRDREPSMQAMASFFWSTIFVLDGDFLRIPKFTDMVNGGTSEYPQNGWHGMYVFSDRFTGGRIYETDMDMNTFTRHAVQASEIWLTQRQWFNSDWRADA